MVDAHKKLERVKYPPNAASPVLVVGAYRYPLMEINDNGIIFSLPDPDIYKMGQELDGRLRFQNSTEMPVTGHVYWKTSTEIMLTLPHDVTRQLFVRIGRDRRAYFRLRYPVNDRPVANLHGNRHNVTEISEFGLRVTTTTMRPLEPGEPVKVSLTFSDNQTLELQSEVYRLDGGEVVLIMKEYPGGIPGTRVTKEQMRFIRQKR